MVLDTYHSTLKCNEEKILKNGLEKSINDSEMLLWLGEGIYCWESIYYAVEWNVIKFEKNLDVDDTFENFCKEYTILKVKIECEDNEILNLSTPEGSIIFNEFKKDILNKEMTSKTKQQLIAKKDEDPFWVDFMINKNVFSEFKVLTAVYLKSIKNKNIDKANNFLEYNQKQIWILDESCSQNIDTYKDEDTIKRMYEIVRENRKTYCKRRKSWIK